MEVWWEGERTGEREVDVTVGEVGRVWLLLEVVGGE